VRRASSGGEGGEEQAGSSDGIIGDKDEDEEDFTDDVSGVHVIGGILSSPGALTGTVVGFHTELHVACAQSRFEHVLAQITTLENLSREHDAIPTAQHSAKFKQ